jgi:DNA-binding FadR family transcriptional regulator
VASSPEPGTTPSQEQKLAEVVAQRLFAEIISGGWEVGSIIGSEAALLDRFEVSRAVLREAVRLLEYHSVARMRRGPGGGLVIAEPDPTASIEAMALYLDYQGTELEHLRVVREAVELACLDGVTGRIGEPETVQRLRMAMHGTPEANPFVDANASEQPGELSNLLHVEFAELTGNPVLALFLRVLITLWARHRQPERTRAGTSSERPPTDRDVMAAQEHQGIVDALLLGDAALARHRMRRHLRGLTDWWH